MFGRHPASFLFFFFFFFNSFLFLCVIWCAIRWPGWRQWVVGRVDKLLNGFEGMNDTSDVCCCFYVHMDICIVSPVLVDRRQWVRGSTFFFFESVTRQMFFVCR